MGSDIERCLSQDPRQFETKGNEEEGHSSRVWLRYRLLPELHGVFLPFSATKALCLNKSRTVRIDRLARCRRSHPKFRRCVYVTALLSSFSDLIHDRTAVFFWGLSTATMYKWAVKRHKTYKKEFGKDYPANRSAMFPGL